VRILIGQFLLAFREALEASIILAIILAYLNRSGRSALSRYAWYGVYLATLLSLILGITIWFMYGSITGPTKALFEGAAAFLAVSVLSYMIYWMATKGRELRIEVERRVENIVTRGSTFSLIFFSFIVVFREELETVLFLTPFIIEDTIGTLIGAFLGVTASVTLAYAVFIVGMKINIRRLFYFTSILLILLAGGLAGYGMHELIEYFEDTGVELGWFGRYAYVLDIPQGSLFHHKGAIGSVLAVMFGYTAEAEWGRLIVHLAYLAIATPLIVYTYRKTQ